MKFLFRNKSRISQNWIMCILRGQHAYDGKQLTPTTIFQVFVSPRIVSFKARERSGLTSTHFLRITKRSWGCPLQRNSGKTGSYSNFASCCVCIIMQQLTTGEQLLLLLLLSCKLSSGLPRLRPASPGQFNSSRVRLHSLNITRLHLTENEITISLNRRPPGTDTPNFYCLKER